MVSHWHRYYSYNYYGVIPKSQLFFIIYFSRIKNILWQESTAEEWNHKKATQTLCPSWRHTRGWWEYHDTCTEKSFLDHENNTQMIVWKLSRMNSVFSSFDWLRLLIHAVILWPPCDSWHFTSCQLCQKFLSVEENMPDHLGDNVRGKY